MVIVVSVMAMLCKSVIDFISNKATLETGGKFTHKFYLIENVTITLLLLIIWIFKIMPVKFDTKSIFYGIIIGLFSFISYLLFLLSLRGENGSVNITIYRLNFVVSSVLAIVFLNESITLNKIIGITFCVAAILIFTNFKQIKASKDNTIILSVLASLTSGIMNLINKIALSSGVESNTLLFYRYLVVLFATILYYKIANIDIKLNMKTSRSLIKYAVFAGALMLLSLNFLYYALKIGDVSIVTPIVQSCFIFTSVMCFVFLKEKLNLKKIMGIIFAVLSIIIIGI